MQWAGEVMTDPTEALAESANLSASMPDLNGLLPALQRLDRLLEQAVAAAQVAYGAEAATDHYRGLYINLADVERLLAREAGVPTLWVDGKGVEEPSPDTAGDATRLDWLARAFGLSSFDVDLILIALAPELDLRYERLYAYLQDDLTRKRPSVDLALNLLCPSAAMKLMRRMHFASEAPLIRHDLLHLIPDPNHVQPPFLAHALKLDEQIVRLLLGQESLDPRLAPFCQVVEPTSDVADISMCAEMSQALARLVIQGRERRQQLRFYFCGPRGVGKRRTAEVLAGEVGTPLLVVDLMRALAADTDFEILIKLVFREAWFRDAILYLDGLDMLRGDSYTLQYQRLVAVLVEDAGITILAGEHPWVPPQVPSGHRPIGVISMPFALPDFVGRRECWQVNLAEAGIILDAYDLEALAGRFRLTPGQIAAAVAAARNHALWLAATQAPDQALPRPSAQPTISDLLTAARAQCGHDLATLAHKIEPVYTWDDIVLPGDALAQLREICQRVVHGHRVLSEWGFGRKLSLGKGVNALFAGSSGTGKTMAAEIIANALQLDLYKIDLSGIVSKYIGETEKNLDRIFAAAENANAILFFDEADALFGKRSEVRDSHDRYANIEISYLLQKMEEYEGITIMATNLRQNLDESFVRRLAFTIHFPFPDEVDRRRIWDGIWPVETPVARDIDLDFLAHQFKLSGGNIKNIALAAAFLAAENGGMVTMAHLIQATRREYQKLGKPLGAAELGSFVSGGTA
jgi:AAA+ superfamily predicted ATPase